MMSGHWILLVLEDNLFPEESLCCAVKLAKRMNAWVSILMLPGKVVDAPPYDGEFDIMMKEAVERIVMEGVHAEGEFKYGDKASAFLKHLAIKPSLRAIVWGGSYGIEAKSMKKRENHWFLKVKSAIQCPVVRPVLKAKTIG